MKSRMLEEEEVLLKIQEVKGNYQDLKESNATEEELAIPAAELIAFELALSHLKQNGTIVIDDQGKWLWYNNFSAT